MAPLATPPRPPPRVGVQDMAPPGGYASIGVARNVPKSVGPRASLLMLAGALVMGGGLYRVGTFNVHRRELKEERAAIRRALTPLLQAEEDARFVRAVCCRPFLGGSLVLGREARDRDHRFPCVPVGGAPSRPAFPGPRRIFPAAQTPCEAAQPMATRSVLTAPPLLCFCSLSRQSLPCYCPPHPPLSSLPTSVSSPRPICVFVLLLPLFLVC